MSEPTQVSKIALLHGGKSDNMANVKVVGEVYECEICGNIVEVKTVGGGELICCMKPMVRME